MQVAVAMAVASGVTGAAQTRSAGKIAKMEADTEAAQIETAAAQREADRKEALARAVSSQMAGAGAAGVGLEGSPLSVIAEDVRRSEEASQRDELMSKIGASAAKAKGKVADAQARGAAILGLLKTGSTAASMASPSSSSMSSIDKGYGTPGSPSSPGYSGTGGGRRWSRGAK